MIPLRDNQPTRSFPIVTILLIAANVWVFVRQVANPLITETYSLVPYELVHGVDHRHAIQVLTDAGVQRIVPVSPHPYWITIFTSMFMHQNVLHIGVNMLYFWIFGNNIEDALGKLRFIVFYLACGVAAVGAQILADPYSGIPMIGASGAIAGVLAAYYLLYPNARVLSVIPIVIPVIAEVRASIVLGLWFVLEVVQGVAGMGMLRNGGVAVYAHIGGFVAGLLLIAMFGGRRLTQRESRPTYYSSDNGAWS